MQGLWHKAYTQIRIYHAISHLGSEKDLERTQAMEALRAIGSASIPALRNTAISTHNEQRSRVRARFAAAVVLHRLGQPEGMSTLIETLRARLPLFPTQEKDLEAAFIAIGSPDAVTALLDLWWQIPAGAKGDLDPGLRCICRVWAALQDPRALEGLIAHADSIPTLFIETVPAFGQMAIPYLKRMGRHINPVQRILAIRALSAIPGIPSFQALVPFLTDTDAFVRAEAPPALEAIGGLAAAPAITAAIQAGCSTESAVHALLRLSAPDLPETLLLLIGRWQPEAAAASGDTEAAVLAALAALPHLSLPTLRPLPIVCGLLERRPSAYLKTAIARFLGALPMIHAPEDRIVRQALWTLLTDVEKGVRTEAAASLAHFGDSMGKQMNQMIDECRPQINLLHKLQAVLRGGPDAGQAASQAVQQVSQWFTRVSKETVDRLSGAGNPTGANMSSTHDPRLSGLLHPLLEAALDALQNASAPEQMEEYVSLSVAVLRALGRIGIVGDERIRRDLLRALHTVKYTADPVLPISPYSPPQREIAELVRTAAAETLLQIYASECFAIFLETLHSPRFELHSTAIIALGRLGDVRALSHLQSIAAEASHPCGGLANEAIAAIRRTNPEMMTLLRASTMDAQPDTLLRPATGSVDRTAPDLLLRPMPPTE
jgi:HEAT repeat protein